MKAPFLSRVIALIDYIYHQQSLEIHRRRWRRQATPQTMAFVCVVKFKTLLPKSEPLPHSHTATPIPSVHVCQSKLNQLSSPMESLDKINSWGEVWGHFLVKCLTHHCTKTRETCVQCVQQATGRTEGWNKGTDNKHVFPKVSLVSFTTVTICSFVYGRRGKTPCWSWWGASMSFV